MVGQAGTPEATDGRHAWRDRNRLAVVDALLDLYGENIVKPSADDIAARSGISRRSLFRYFDDMDELCRAAIARQADRVGHLFAVKDLGEGPLAERIDRLVEQRIRLFDAIAPVRRVAKMRAPLQPILAQQLRTDASLLRRQLERHFDTDLAALDAAARVQTLAAADALTSFEAFDHMTANQGLTLAEVRAAIKHALLALLAAPRV